MMLTELRDLLAATEPTSDRNALQAAVLQENILGKKSEAARARSFRYLRELYELDPNEPSFRALQTLWRYDPDAQPLIALSSALTHDSALRATAAAVLRAPIGTQITADDLAAAVLDSHPTSYSDAIAHKIGRNAASTWTQSGHLTGRTKKTRSRANPRPASVAYSLFLGSLEGREGEVLFESLAVQAQDAPIHSLKELAREASRRGWLDFRSIGTVTEVGFAYLTPKAIGST